MPKGLSYKLEKFEGPLDLLLHLIEKNKINIYDIPVSDITVQYMEYVSATKDDNLDTMSEFLVMAATLLDIKARLLLPKEIDKESGNEIDPRDELVEKLLEYKKFKLMAQELLGMEFEAQRFLYKECLLPKEVAGYEQPVVLDRLLEGIELYKLKTIFEDIIRRSEDKVDKQRSRFGTIKKEALSLRERINSLLSYARAKRKFSFRGIFEKKAGRLELVVTFLALLELMKIGKIKLRQEILFDDMEIELLEEGEREEVLELKDLEDF